MDDLWWSKRPFVTYWIFRYFFLSHNCNFFRLFDKWLKLKVTIVFVAVCQSFCLIFVFHTFFRYRLANWFETCCVALKKKKPFWLLSLIKIDQDGLTIGEEINLKRLVFDHESGSSFKKNLLSNFLEIYLAAT